METPSDFTAGLQIIFAASSCKFCFPPPLNCLESFSGSVFQKQGRVRWRDADPHCSSRVMFTFWDSLLPLLLPEISVVIYFIKEQTIKLSYNKQKGILKSTELLLWNSLSHCTAGQLNTNDGCMEQLFEGSFYFYYNVFTLSWKSHRKLKMRLFWKRKRQTITNII